MEPVKSIASNNPKVMAIKAGKAVVMAPGNGLNWIIKKGDGPIDYFKTKGKLGIFVALIILLIIIVLSSTLTGFQPFEGMCGCMKTGQLYVDKFDPRIMLAKVKKVEGVSEMEPHYTPASAPMSNPDADLKTPWNESILNLGVEKEVMASHAEHVEARLGTSHDDYVLKLAVVKNGVVSRDPSDVSAADPSKVRCQYFHKSDFSAAEIAAGEFKDDKAACASGMHTIEHFGAMKNGANSNTGFAAVREVDEGPVARVGPRRRSSANPYTSPHARTVSSEDPEHTASLADPNAAPFY